MNAFDFDMSIFLIITYAIFGIAFFSLVVFLGVNATKIKGWFGEKNISNRLEKLDANKYITLNDILIKNEKGNTSQIDHLVVSVFQRSNSLSLSILTFSANSNYCSIFVLKLYNKTCEQFYRNFGI